MKLSKLTTATLLASSLLFAAGSAVAKPGKHHGENVDRNVIKVKAVEEKGVKVFVGQDGQKHKFSFEFEQLNDLNELRNGLSELDAETVEDVMSILEQVAEHDGKAIEIKDADFTKDDKGTSVYSVKTIDSEGKLHIEVDVEGDEKFIKRKFNDKSKRGDKGPRKDIRKMVRHHLEHGDGEKLTKMITKLINKADLNADQLAAIQTAIADKQAN